MVGCGPELILRSLCPWVPECWRVGSVGKHHTSLVLCVTLLISYPSPILAGLAVSLLRFRTTCQLHPHMGEHWLESSWQYLCWLLAMAAHKLCLFWKSPHAHSSVWIPSVHARTSRLSLEAGCQVSPAKLPPGPVLSTQPQRPWHWS